ncbi:MAG: enoyl-CoA hydratase/isomerase family protein [Alphaproteobacteria bacterium]|nr:enoyl-CoA hydratase/isomerase family protein [Alphaproteobacteria bacterium]
MSHTPPIITHIERGVMTVTLNRPHVKNAMNFEMVDALVDAFKSAANADSVRALVLRGADGTFCAGGDLKELSSGNKDKDAIAQGNRRFGELLELAQGFPKLLVTVAEKAAMGGGFGLVCVSDVAIAESGCRFGMPEVVLGLIPAQIAPFVCARIGLTETRRLALTGLIIDGFDAQRLGLVHHHEDGEKAVEARLQIVLKQAMKAGPEAVKTTKAILNGMAGVKGATLDEAANLFADTLLSDEGIEGTRAFVEKRPASWMEMPK